MWSLSQGNHMHRLRSMIQYYGFHYPAVVRQGWLLTTRWFMSSPPAWEGATLIWTEGHPVHALGVRFLAFIFKMPRIGSSNVGTQNGLRSECVSPFALQ